MAIAKPPFFIPVNARQKKGSYGFLDILSLVFFMAKFRVRYRRGESEREFETVVEVNAFTRNQAMVKIKENSGAYKDLAFGDVKILNVEKVESWQQ